MVNSTSSIITVSLTFSKPVIIGRNMLSIEVSHSLASDINVDASGKPAPVSHLLTACGVMFNSSANDS